jgi:hypothetical protein
LGSGGWWSGHAITAGRDRNSNSTSNSTLNSTKTSSKICIFEVWYYLR